MKPGMRHLLGSPMDCGVKTLSICSMSSYVSNTACRAVPLAGDGVMVKLAESDNLLVRLCKQHFLLHNYSTDSIIVELMGTISLLDGNAGGRLHRCDIRRLLCVRKLLWAQDMHSLQACACGLRQCSLNGLARHMKLFPSLASLSIQIVERPEFTVSWKKNTS